MRNTSNIDRLPVVAWLPKTCFSQSPITPSHPQGWVQGAQFDDADTGIAMIALTKQRPVEGNP